MRLWPGLAAIVALMQLAAPSSSADESGAADFVRAIYRTYEGANAQGQPMHARAARARLFTPSLAKLIEDDYEPAARRGEVGRLNFDPFIRGQDFEVSRVAVSVKPAGPDRALATVTYINIGEPAITQVYLVKFPSGWRIDDIRWSESETLRGFFGRAGGSGRGSRD